MKIITDPYEAERVYTKFYPKPTHIFEAWDFRRAVMRFGPDTFWFINGDDFLIPLQIAEAAMIEPFGSYNIEDVDPRTWGNPEKVDEVLQWLSRLYIQICALVSPVRAARRSEESCWMLPLTTMEDWLSSLSKTRRWEIRKGEQHLPPTLFLEVTSKPHAKELYDRFVYLHLHTKGNEHDEFANYFHKEYFWNMIEWGVDHSALSCCYREQGCDLLTMDFTLLDPYSHQCVWIMGANVKIPHMSLGMVSIKDVVELALRQKSHLIHGMQGKCAKEKAGFTERQLWELVTRESD